MISEVEIELYYYCKLLIPSAFLVEIELFIVLEDDQEIHQRTTQVYFNSNNTSA